MDLGYSKVKKKTEITKAVLVFTEYPDANQTRCLWTCRATNGWGETSLAEIFASESYCIFPPILVNLTWSLS